MKLSSGDQNEAHELAHLTFVRALEAPRGELDRDLDLRLWLFSIMRSVFHSVERQRTMRRERGFTVHRLALPGHA
jgi:DNA-directed RNA polymerase specialized sigma24 family protein